MEARTTTRKCGKLALLRAEADECAYREAVVELRNEKAAQGGPLPSAVLPRLQRGVQRDTCNR